MLNRYLFDARTDLERKKTIHLVMGNEASDLDSMASSVMYACFREKKSADSGSLYIPLINIPEEDFKLRTEAVYLFREAGIEEKNLLYTDQLNLEELHKKGKLKLILIDHNRLSKSQEFLADSVEEILDHHKDEEMYSSAVKTIQPVGSCTTLVTEKIMASDRKFITEDIAKLAAGTILLDTVNLSAEAGRVTPQDEKVFDYLEKEFSLDRKKLFDTLQFEKFNTSSLSTGDILRKDYKEWIMGGKKSGFSSALISIKNWLEKDTALVDSISSYYKKRKLDLLFVMIAYTEPEFTRELILFSEDTEMKKKMFAHLEKNSLGLEKYPGKAPENPKADFYLQKNASYSRKKLQPVIQDFFNQQ